MRVLSLPREATTRLGVWLIPWVGLALLGRVPLMRPDGQIEPSQIEPPQLDDRSFVAGPPLLDFWWPAALAVFAVGTVALLCPSAGRWQRRLVDASRTARHHWKLWALLIPAQALRVFLAYSGGQYFDWDEQRYGWGTTNLFLLLSQGKCLAALDLLLYSPDHAGFRIVGLFPALVHTVGAWSKGTSIASMQAPSGEWMAAAVFSMASVAVIGLVYALALRTGATPEQALAAAVLATCSRALLLYSRHFFPYDTSLALALLALWLGMSPTASARPSIACGLACGASFLTYNGHWSLVLVIAAVHLTRVGGSHRGLARRALPFALSVAAAPAALVLAGAWRGIDFLQGSIDFSISAGDGERSLGWVRPWAFLSHVEGGLLPLLGLGALVGLRGVRGRIGLLWIGLGAGVYLAMGLASAFHEFTAYDRAARVLVPFLCLAAAEGLGRAMSLRSRKGACLCALLALHAGVAFWPLINQRYPREIVNDAVRAYGRDVRAESVVSGTVNQTAFSLAVNELNSPPRARYVVLNAKDLWFWTRPALTSLPAGRVLLRTRHPRQLPFWQYHGYLPEEREWIRAHDLSIEVIDTRPDLR